MPCKTCGGQGAQSNIVSAEIIAQCSYDFDANSLPAKAAAVIKELGAGLTECAQITPVIKGNDEEGGQEGEQEQDTLHLLYEVHVPQGNIEFAVKNRTVQAYLFGAQGTIKEIPDFLEGVIAPGIKKLAQAASGQGSVGENIRSAVKYKTVRQAVTAAARYSAKKAVKAILHYTPLGLSEQVAQKLIEDANTALNNATKQQRIIAVAVGLSSGLVLCALYFLSALRSALLAQVANESLHIAVDLMVLGLCATIGYVAWQTMSSRARKQALENFISPKK